MKALMIIGLILALVATAHAEPPPVLHPGSRCFVVDKDGEKLGALTVTVPQLVVPVTEAAAANAKLEKCIGMLTSCRSKAKPESKFKAAAKYTALGAALLAMFLLGRATV